MEVTIKLEPIGKKLELFGPSDRHLRLLRAELEVRITARGAELVISGHARNVKAAAEVIDKMQKHLIRHSSLAAGDIKLFIEKCLLDQPAAAPRLLVEDKSGASHEGRKDTHNAAVTVYAQKMISPSTKAQLKYVETMHKNDITFCVGPAGTGKTYLAVAVAVSMLKKKQIRRIILARPAVEAGEKLGFLPGDIAAKVNPYLRPLFDALEDMMEFAQMKKFTELDIIEIIPLAFMRGRTLNDSVIICDEAQNTSPLQMLMVLTRLGLGSKMIITGDITQIDLEKGKKSGLIEAIERLRRIKGIGYVELTQKDIVRHKLLHNIVRAYGKNRE